MVPAAGVGLAFCEQPFSVREVVHAAQRAESIGFDSFWMAEDLWTRRDGLTYLTCVANATERMTVGTSVVTPYTHHPLQLAATFNTLWDLAPHRLRLGIGAGTESWRPIFG